MKKIIFLAPILIMLALFGVISPAGAQQPMSAELTIPTGEWTVGDPLPLTLTIHHPAHTFVVLPELGEQWGDFVIAGHSQPQTITNEDGSQTTVAQIDARLFSPGDFQTPPLSVEVADQSGQLTGVVAEPLSVSIASVLVEGDEALRDIKPQAELPVSNMWLVALLAALLAAVAALTLYAIHRRQLRLARMSIDTRLPHEVALDELARVAALRLPRQGAFKEHYDLVAGAVRLYLQDAFHVPTMERTTAELRAGLQGAVIAPDISRRFVAILTECDLVKFADITPDVAGAEAILAEARASVEFSKPVAPAQTEAGDSGHTSTLNGQLSTAEVSA